MKGAIMNMMAFHAIKKSTFPFSIYLTFYNFLRIHKFLKIALDVKLV